MTLPRNRLLIAVVAGCAAFFSATPVDAQPNNLRAESERARQLEREYKWEEARVIYEKLLSQDDQGLRIRERYHQVLRHCWQIRRHDDISYRKEVLSVDYGQALKIHNIIANTLLTRSVDRKKIDPTKLFRKGLEEFEAALNDPHFRQHHDLENKRPALDELRSLLRNVARNTRSLKRLEAANQIAHIAMAAEKLVGLNPTVVVMEFACGSCYAIDDYTVYLTPNQLRELAQTLNQADAVNIGISVRERDDKIIVSSVWDDSPARGAVNENDEIIAVDKQQVANLLKEKRRELTRELLNGAPGTFVEIESLSPGKEMTTIVRIQRRAIMPYVIPYMLTETDVGVIKITGFTDATVEDLDVAVASLTELGMKRLILDLRQNPGGVFESAIDTARRFVAQGVLASEIYQDSKVKLHQAKNPNAWTMPLVVLIDNDTASAAEVLAGALKDTDRAFLIGQTTYGKGCIQDILKLPNAAGGVPAGGMKLTISRFFSPKGHPYSGRGVIPHLFVDERMADSQAMMARDLYIVRAVEELNRMTMMK